MLRCEILRKILGDSRQLQEIQERRRRFEFVRGFGFRHGLDLDFDMRLLRGVW